MTEEGKNSTTESYQCTLSPELAQKAERELNEKPEWRSRDIQALREMVNKNTELHIRTDDAFLLRFLRAKKFEYDRAYNLLLSHFQMKKENPKLFENLCPSAVKHVLEAGITGVLRHRDKEGRRVMVFRPGKWDPSRFPIDDVFRTNFISLSKIIQDEATQVNGVVMVMDLEGVGWAHAKSISPFYAKRAMSLLQEEETQINGMMMIMDLKKVGWKHVKNISPMYSKKILSLLQDAFPARFKGIHYINEPAVFDYIFAIAKQFMKEKTVSRLHFHGKNVSELTEYIDPEYLPEDYGGKAPPYSNTDWMQEILLCEAEFNEEAKYGLTSGSTINQKSGQDAMECVMGSYRKLSVE
ncbi:alpha-tocopherol transfer protein-like isoform X3 [Ostrea edulis]|uniref:alpha-tocopherol transfer protein-like isoform X3 n=1 Tax=Ostrea edulis TaxID=37623 RepID=UPI0024AF579E|nr:alpha-tocopherol transfer protein-like isoform X3 [Ostrea edulis]